MIAAFVVVGLCSVGAAPASAQSCSMSFYQYDESVVHPQLGAYTVEGDYCPTSVARVEAWIRYQTNAWCDSASTKVGSTVCARTADPSELEAYTSNQGTGCELWEGLSKHIAITGSSWFFFNNGQPFSQDLQARRCHLITEPEECLDENYGYWDYELQSCIPYNTPILVPLRRSQNYQLTDRANGVVFDFDGDGITEQTAWTAAGSRLAFLAIDRDGNGAIDGGSELLGNHTIAGANNGFEALDLLNQQMGGTRRPSIDSDAPIFAKLLLWEDANHNGVSEPNELTKAGDYLASIGIGLQQHSRRDRHGNLFAWRGFAQVRTAPGKNVPQSAAEDRERTIVLYDVIFTSK